MLKISKLCEIGDCMTPRQWLNIVDDMCDYLRMCGLEYSLQYIYTDYSTMLFNLKCLFLMLRSRDQLSCA